MPFRQDQRNVKVYMGTDSNRFQGLVLTAKIICISYLKIDHKKNRGKF